MSVAEQTVKAVYQCNGETVDFPVPFAFNASADLVVKVYNTSTAVTTTLTLGTDYTVSGSTVHTLTAYGSAYKLSILRDTEISQTTVWYDGGRMPAASLNEGLDKRCMVEQELAEKLSRAVIEDEFHEGTSIADIRLLAARAEAAADRAEEIVAQVSFAVFFEQIGPTPTPAKPEAVDSDTSASYGTNYTWSAGGAEVSAITYEEYAI